MRAVQRRREGQTSADGIFGRDTFINTPGYSYDVAADGARFLVVEVPEHTQALTKLAVITNGFEELKRKAEAAQ